MPLCKKSLPRKIVYPALGFLGSFGLLLLGIRIDDTLVDVSFTNSSSNIQHYLIPLIFGFAGSILGHLLETQVSKDLKDKADTLEKIRQKENKYRALFETMPDVACILDNDKNIIDINQKGVDLYEYSREELLKMSVDQCVYKGDKKNSDAFFQELRNDGSYELYEGRIITKSGKIIWIQVNSTTIIENGIQVGSQDIIRDITKQKETEKALRETTRKLSEHNAEKAKFFSIIAHDLKSPFNSFLGLTRLMVEELPSLSRDDIQKIAISLQNSSNKLFNLLENLLHWANSQQGLITYTPMPLYISKIVNESILTLSDFSKSKEIKILNTIPEEYLVNADQNLLQTILRNLISNAIKFTSKKGNIELSATPTTDKKLILSVKDSGIGMKKEMLENLFKLDVQTSREGTDGESSTGLGLILCKEFVQKQGGEIWVESQENKGTTFYFTLEYFS